MTFELGINFDQAFASPVPATEVVVGRELTLADYAALDMPTSSLPYQVRRITERHHALARAIALGLRDGEAAVRIGFSPEMVAILKKSPAFMDLIEIYRGEVDLVFAEHAAQIAGLSADAILELRRRLEDDPDGFSSKMLLEITTAMGDRAGYGPIKRTENVNVNVSLGEKLALARARVASVKDITPPENQHG